VDHHPEPFLHEPEAQTGPARKTELTAEEIASLAEMGELRASAPGVVVDLKVEAGARVREGDLLLVLEAMKMLHRVVSPLEGAVRDLGVRPGQQVARGDLLVRIRPRRSGEEEGREAKAP
jgi:biotin carboxyl carrier protein